jgi:serine/threonine protein phosphatase 1
MDSFGVEACADIPAQYLNWMKALPYYLEIDGYILVHAGLEFSLPNPFSDLREMCWIRNWYHEIDYTWLGERIIIHGHTPIELNRIKYQAQNLDSLKYLDIDAGCVYADALRWTVKDMGNLCAFDLDNRKLYFQPCLEY